MIALLILLIALQLGDWLSTRILLKLGGREKNPPLRWLIGELGVDMALALKTGIVVVIGVALLSWPWPFLAALSVAYAWVVLSNLRVIARLRARAG